MPLWGHPEHAQDNNYEAYFADFSAQGVFLAEHVMHLEEKLWLSVQEVMEKY